MLSDLVRREVTDGKGSDAFCVASVLNIALIGAINTMALSQLSGILKQIAIFAQKLRVSRHARRFRLERLHGVRLMSLAGCFV